MTSNGFAHTATASSTHIAAFATDTITALGRTDRTSRPGAEHTAVLNGQPPDQSGTRRAVRGAGKLAGSEPVPAWVWRMPDMRAALAARDIGLVFRILQQHTGLSQRDIAKRTGQSQSEISAVMSGRHISSYDVLVRIAEGLAIPRGYLGLAYAEPAEAPLAADVTIHPASDAERDGRPADGTGEDPPSVAVTATPTSQSPCARCAGARPVIGRWTGVEIRALRQAKRMSVRQFAAYLGVSDRMVSKWESGDLTVAPRPLNQAALDTALALADDETLRRFVDALTEVAVPPRSSMVWGMPTEIGRASSRNSRGR